MKHRVKLTPPDAEQIKTLMAIAGHYRQSAAQLDQQIAQLLQMRYRVNITDEAWVLDLGQRTLFREPEDPPDGTDHP